MKNIAVSNVLEILNKNIQDACILPDQVDDDLSEHGMDSVSFIRIVVLLEEEFECEIPDSKLLPSEMNTAKKIYDVLRELAE